MTVTMVVTSCRLCLTLNTGILKFFADPRDRDHGRDLLTLNTGILTFFADPLNRDRDLLPALPDPQHSNSILKFFAKRKSLVWLA